MKAPQDIIIEVDADIPAQLRGNAVFVTQRSRLGYVSGVYGIGESGDSIRALEQQVGGDSATEIKISGLKEEIAVMLGMHVSNKPATVQKITREELIRVLQNMIN